MAVTEEADVGESILIYTLKELKTQAYKKTMKIDISNINTFEKRNKVSTIKWRTIYKVIEEAYFKKYDIHPDGFIKM